LKLNASKSKQIISAYKIIILGIISTFLFLIIESIVDPYFFKLSDNIYQEIFTTDAHEIFIHVLVMCLIFFIGIYGQLLFNKQRRTEQKLRVSEEWYSTTLKSIGDAVITTDINGVITFLNHVAVALTGWELREAMGRPIGDIFHIINELTRKEVENPVERVINEGIVVGLANHSILIAKDKKEIPIDDSGAPLKDDQGNLIGVVLIFRDITERKKTEEAEREVLKARQERLAMLGQLAGGVGHELRNPLGAIKNATYFLKMALEDPEEDIRETLEVLDKEISMSEMIINSLLGFARPKSPLLRKLEMNNVIQDVLSHILIPEKVEVVKNFDETLPSFLADPDQLTHIFGNIIINAIQAMPDGGRLLIKTELTGPEWITISFADTGVGIPKENIEKLFEPLFTTKAKGIGLGLAIAKIMIDVHGGEIEVESEVERGSTLNQITNQCKEGELTWKKKPVF